MLNKNKQHCWLILVSIDIFQNKQNANTVWLCSFQEIDDVILSLTLLLTWTNVGALEEAIN